MKIILQKPVTNLGTPGEVVEVADGYARNYLMPRGLAIVASKGAVKDAEGLRRAHEQRDSKARAEAEELATGITAVPLRVLVKAGEDGKLFGSVTAAEIAEAIESAVEGVELDKRTIHLPEPIRSTGTHAVQVKLHPEVVVDISLEVEAAP
ncbi:MAG: 50S ribosomal protein L9 [Actinomycetota bacterium]